MLKNLVSYIKLNYKFNAIVELKEIIRNEKEEKPGDAQRHIQELPHLLEYASHATHPIRYYVDPSIINMVKNLTHTVENACEKKNEPAVIHLAILAYFVKYLPDISLRVFHGDDTGYFKYVWSNTLKHLLIAGLMLPNDILKTIISNLLNLDTFRSPKKIYPWFTDAIKAGILNQFILDAKHVSEDLSSCRFFSKKLRRDEPDLNHYVLEFPRFRALKQVADQLTGEESRALVMCKINALLIEHFEELLSAHLRTLLMITSIPGALGALETIKFTPVVHPELGKVLPGEIGALVTEYGYFSNLQEGQELWEAEAKEPRVTEAAKITALAVRATWYAELLNNNESLIAEQCTDGTPAGALDFESKSESESKYESDSDSDFKPQLELRNPSEDQPPRDRLFSNNSSRSVRHGIFAGEKQPLLAKRDGFEDSGRGKCCAIL